MVQLVDGCVIQATMEIGALDCSQRGFDASVSLRSSSWVSMVVASRLASFASMSLVLLRSNSSVTVEGLRFGGAGEIAGSWMTGLVGACEVSGDRMTGVGLRCCLRFGFGGADGAGGLKIGVDARTGWRRVGAAPGMVRSTGAP